MNKNDLINFELDNNPAHKGTGKFVEFADEGMIIIELLTDIKEFKAGNIILISEGEII